MDPFSKEYVLTLLPNASCSSLCLWCLAVFFETQIREYVSRNTRLGRGSEILKTPFYYFFSMSVRRSSRFAKPASAITETVAESIAVEVSEKRKKSSIVKKKTVKRPKFEHGKEPPHWRTVYERIQEFRKHNFGPVDTMGCERLAQEDIPEKARSGKKRRERRMVVFS
ncbi:hypothetical protein BX666DRAFT_1927316 [Dichotomocladium elegans]|nr:hypothetical protein BX666DRAFT_1927316 [Dichotomocladium elegans]